MRYYETKSTTINLDRYPGSQRTLDKGGAKVCGTPDF
jgi:hypothetical protein